MKLFIFQNNTKADLIIPNNKGNGNIILKKDSKFIGDEYYFTYVKPPLNLLKFIEEVKTEEVDKKEVKTEEVDKKEVKTEEVDKKEVKNKIKIKAKRKTKRKKNTKNKLNNKEEKMENKLILEQPDRVSIEKDEEKINEEILLIEQPAGGMELINEDEVKKEEIKEKE